MATRAESNGRTNERPYYEMVASLSAQLSSLPTTNTSQGIDQALRVVAESLPAERVSLYLRSPDATSYVEVACSSTIAGQSVRAVDMESFTAKEGIEGFSLSDFPWLAGQLGKAESVCWADVSELPEMARAERSLFRATDTESLLFVPMLAQGVLLGFLKADAIGAPRQWPAEAPALTRVVLDMLGNMLERARGAAKLARTEERLQTTQRLETVGRLASGIAHDFNNYLTAIFGYGELLSLEFEDDPRGKDEIQEILHAADRASELVEQILSFSRAKSDDAKILDLNSVVAMLAKIVGRIVGESVDVDYQLGADIGAVRVDAVRLDQVVLNLVSNARDAMSPSGGRLTLATNDVRVDDSRRVQLTLGDAAEQYEVYVPAGLSRGPYVVMSVADTGSGMDDQTRERLFEPFYTTKNEGRGTGIGLATVAGIVEACGGAIAVESEIGVGSTFHLFFPAVKEAAVMRTRDYASHALMSGSGETVLLVESEAIVRGLFEKVLTRCGYSVHAVEDGPAAISFCQTRDGPIHLFMTDLAMPRLCGREIANQILEMRPEIRVLFTSGYTEESLRSEGVLDDSTHIVEKPFAVHALAEKMRRALEPD